jgi:hypothetical protein
MLVAVVQRAVGDDQGNHRANHQQYTAGGLAVYEFFEGG